MLSLHFGPSLVVWKVGWNEMSFNIPCKPGWDSRTPGAAAGRADVLWPGLGEEGAAQGSGTPAQPQNQEKELKLHNVTFPRAKMKFLFPLSPTEASPEALQPRVSCPGHVLLSCEHSCSLVVLAGPWGGQALMFRDFLQLRAQQSH